MGTSTETGGEEKLLVEPHHLKKWHLLKLHNRLGQLDLLRLQVHHWLVLL